MAKLDYPIIDADSHLTENLERVCELIDRRHRQYGPRMLDQGPSELFYLGGAYLPQPPGLSWGETCYPGAYREKPRRPRKYRESHIVGFDPKARLEMMDEHGVHGTVIFQSMGLFAGAIPNPEISAAVCRGFNRYIAEYCSADRARLWGMATVPLADPSRAAEEARYAVKELGLIGVFAPSGVHGPQPLYHPYYTPFFDAIAELGVPFGTHTGAAIMYKGLGFERFPGLFPPFHLCTHASEAQISLMGMLAYGVLDSRPGLKIGFFEAGAGWAPFVIDKMHERFEDMGWMMPDLKTDPRETFAERCLVTVETDEALLPATLDYFGGRGVAWSSDLPHFDAEDDGRPDALIAQDRISGAYKRRLLFENAVEFFGLKIGKAVRAAAE